MSHIIIDRRLNGKGKSTVNRRKFIKRVRNRVKETVKEAVRGGKISDIVSDKREKVNIPVKDIQEPTPHHDEGGIVERILPGNKKYIKGDREQRPPKGGGEGGNEGSPDGEGEDDFTFSISREEFLDFFFEDLELPDLIRKELAKTDDFKIRRSGFSNDGNPSRLDIVRSMRKSVGRRIALRNPKKRKLRELEAELEALNKEIDARKTNGEDVSIETARRDVVIGEINVLKRKIKAIPFVDDIDLQYRQWTKQPVPATQAVMFCIMDVSGSMSEWHKEMSKRFFMLLYLFLNRNYDHIELVFIRHHHQAQEVDEDTFFYSRESGGTVVSPALELMRQIIDERYNTSAWNVYGCQASDGDNWGDDELAVEDVMTQKILPVVQYFAYVEITDERSQNRNTELWETYEKVDIANDNFAMVNVQDPTDIYPVFRGLFEKK